VILAAVIATFVLGLGDNLSNTAPQASFSFDYTENAPASDDSLEVTHDGGDSIEAARINATVSGALNNNPSGGTGPAIFGASTSTSGDGDLFTGGTVNAGTTDTLSKGDFHASGGSALGNNLDLSEATIRVVFSGESGDSSATLGRWEGPDA
jgi:FlaG/FlaF family flagellin (archaellin)